MLPPLSTPCRLAAGKGELVLDGPEAVKPRGELGMQHRSADLTVRPPIRDTRKASFTEASRSPGGQDAKDQGQLRDPVAKIGVIP